MWDIFKSKERLIKEFNAQNSNMWHAWNKVYTPILLELLKNEIDIISIKEIHFLLNFLKKESYLNECLENITRKNYKRLSKMSGLVPFSDYDTDHPMYDVIYITGYEKTYFAIIDNSHEGTEKDLTLKHIIETEPIDRKKFLESRLIYPV
jgi:hypothetical protein